jgi:hypothetical protein
LKRPNLGIQGTPISAVVLCEHLAGAPDARRYAALTDRPYAQRDGGCGAGGGMQSS